MKIYVFEDKPEEVGKAKQAIEERGHICIVAQGVLLLAENFKDFVEGKQCTPPEGLDQLAMDNWIVENDPRYGSPYMERQREAGFLVKTCLEELIACKERDESVGVITDLFFPLTRMASKTPSGLLVVAHAVGNRIPVVICTDCEGDPDGHHGEAIGFIFDGYVRRVGAPVFGLEEYKDWGNAVHLLEERVRK